MSQQKSLTKLEKGKLLKEVRKRLHLNQRQMAGILNLDPTYLSQLENGKREVDDWYVQRAAELEAEFEKSKEVKGTLNDGPGLPAATRENCVGYLNKFLDTCDEPSKLGWTLIELHEHFPMDKWPKKKISSDRVDRLKRDIIAIVPKDGSKGAK